MKNLIVLIVLLFSLNVYAASQQTSSTTAATIIDNVEYLLNDETNEMWSAGSLLTWLNEGQRIIALKSECLQTTESIDLATDTLEYTITSDYVAVKAVHYIDTDSAIKALLPGSPVSVGMVDNPSEPVYWYDWGGKLGVYPTITRTTETVTVYLITRPAVLVSTDNITIPTVYESALTFYMMARAWMRDRTYSKYARMTALFDAEMERIRNDLNRYPAQPITD
jgi:hypothetical protein